MQFTRRAAKALGDLREHHESSVCGGRTVLQRSSTGELLWWTWAGTAVNRTLHASLPSMMAARQRIGDRAVQMRSDREPREVADALRDVDPADITDPPVDAGALTGLKFASALPLELARATLASRFADRLSAARVLTENRTIVRSSE